MVAKTQSGGATRRTGILRNDLYAGRLIWNKQRYVRDPHTGKRVARINPESEWIIEDVPKLRIIDDGLWKAVQNRLDAVRQSDRSQAIRNSQFWKDRRPRQLLTSLVHCGACGGSMAAIGSDYLACQTARSGAGCTSTKGIRRSRIEEAVLEGLKSRLMRPQLVEEFIRAFHEEVNKQHRETALGLEQKSLELLRVTAKLDGLYDAIADRLRTDGLKEKLEDLERRKAELEDAIARSPEPEPYLHPNLAGLYRDRVEALHQALNEPQTRGEAAAILRTLVERVDIAFTSDGAIVQLPATSSSS